MKVRVKRQFKILEGIFDIGDECELTSILVEEDSSYTRHFTMRVWEEDPNRPGWGRFVKQLCPEEVIIEKDSYKTFKVDSKNGKTYGEEFFNAFVGIIPLEKIFVKI